VSEPRDRDIENATHYFRTYLTALNDYHRLREKCANAEDRLEKCKQDWEHHLHHMEKEAQSCQ